MAFKKGQSGNPTGRPKGVVDRRVKWRRTLEKDVPAILKKSVDMALAGDSAMARFLLERVLPRARGAVVRLGEFSGPLHEQGAQVLTAMAEGRITADDAAAVLSALASQARLVELGALEERLARLETALGTAR